MFWIGFLIGLFVGANVGLLAAGLLMAKRRQALKRAGADEALPAAARGDVRAAKRSGAPGPSEKTD